MNLQMHINEYSSEVSTILQNYKSQNTMKMPKILCYLYKASWEL